MSIQRYTPFDSEVYGPSMVDTSDGRYVLYADHAAEVARLKAKIQSSRVISKEKDQTIIALTNDRNQLDSDLAKITAEVARLTGERDDLVRQRDGYKKAANDIICEMFAKEEQDRIGNDVASLLSYTIIVQGLPKGMVNEQSLRKSVEDWRESRKRVDTNDVTTVQRYRAERDVAMTRAGELQSIVSACMERLGMTQTAWDGTDIPRGEQELPRWVNAVCSAAYQDGQRAERAEEALRKIVGLDVQGDDESNNCEAWGMHLEKAVEIARAYFAAAAQDAKPRAVEPGGEDA